jgi:hypothetical protein
VMFYRFAILVCLLAVLGCGGTATKVTPPSPAVEAKIELERIAETGMVDSTVFILREKLEEVKEADEAKGTELLAALDELEKLEDRKGVSKKAEEMIAKLEGGAE